MLANNPYVNDSEGQGNFTVPIITGTQQSAVDQSYGYYVEHIHSPLAMAITVFGILANGINIVVLTRQNMLGPTNLLLTGLSIAQLGLVLNYMAQVSYDKMSEICIEGWHGFGWTFYKLINVNLNIIFHTVALCHTVILSLFRYVAIKHPTKARTFVTTRSARLATTSAFLTVPIICLPVYFATVIEKLSGEDMIRSYPPCYFSNNSGPYYDLRYSSNHVLTQVPIWMFGTVFKICPCIVISIFSYLLIGSLKKVEERKLQLKGVMANTSSASVRQHQQRNRITLMLVIIVVLFVAVELPQGILAFSVGVSDQHFAYTVYNKLGPPFEMLTLLYSSINFILYCTMSTQFQDTFKALICPQDQPECLSLRWARFKRRWEYQAVPQRKKTSNNTLLNENGAIQHKFNFAQHDVVREQDVFL